MRSKKRGPEPFALARIRNGADAAMFEARRGPHFAEEAMPGVAIGIYAGRQELDGYLPPEDLILGAIHHAHPAPAEF